MPWTAISLLVGAGVGAGVALLSQNAGLGVAFAAVIAYALRTS